MMEDLRELVITLTWAMALLIIGFDSDVRWLDRHAPRLSFLDPRLLEAAMSEGVAATNIPRAIMDDPDRLRARRSVLFRRFMTSWPRKSFHPFDAGWSSSFSERRHTWKRCHCGTGMRTSTLPRVGQP